MIACPKINNTDVIELKVAARLLPLEHSSSDTCVCLAGSPLLIGGFFPEGALA